MDLKLKINADGEIFREDDKKHLATVNFDTAEVKYENPAYAKGAYKEAILALAGGERPAPEEPDELPNSDLDEEVEDLDPRVPGNPPERDPSLGAFSAPWINYDHQNLSDEQFAAKYRGSAAAQLDFIARRPALFADREALEERLVTLATA